CADEAAVAVRREERCGCGRLGRIVFADVAEQMAGNGNECAGSVNAGEQHLAVIEMKTREAGEAVEEPDHFLAWRVGFIEAGVVCRVGWERSSCGQCAALQMKCDVSSNGFADF